MADELFDKAIEAYKQSEEIRINIDDVIGLASTLRNIGDAYARHGDYHTAIKYGEHALRMAEETGVVRVSRDAAGLFVSSQ